MDRAVLGALLGRFPEVVDANPRTVERTDMGTYVQERVEYDVEHDERVAAFVLVPKHRPKLCPGIVAHHQHAGQWDLGKSEVAGLRGDPDQAYGKELAERGYIVFAPDAVGFAPYGEFLARDAGVQMEFVVPGIMNAGDLVDVLRLGAPAQILISATTDDKWSRGADELFEAAKSAFPEGNLALKTWPGSHVFTREMREAAYAFVSMTG
jgi:hypothetical protein